MSSNQSKVAYHSVWVTATRLEKQHTCSQKLFLHTMSREVNTISKFQSDWRFGSKENFGFFFFFLYFLPSHRCKVGATKKTIVLKQVQGIPCNYTLARIVKRDGAGEGKKSKRKRKSHWAVRRNGGDFKTCLSFTDGKWQRCGDGSRERSEGHLWPIFLFFRHFEFFISILELWLREVSGSRLMANDEDDKEVAVAVSPFCTLFRGQ